MAADAFQTRCPFCQALFRVRPEHLAVADGKVRCGNCFGVFLATAHAVASAPAGHAPEAEAVLSSGPLPESPPRYSAGTPDDERDAEERFDDDAEEQARKRIAAANSAPVSMASTLRAPVHHADPGLSAHSPATYGLPSQDISELRFCDERGLDEDDEPAPSRRIEPVWRNKPASSLPRFDDDVDELLFDDNTGLGDAEDGEEDEPYYVPPRRASGPVKIYDPLASTLEVDESLLDDSVLGPLPPASAPAPVPDAETEFRPRVVSELDPAALAQSFGEPSFDLDEAEAKELADEIEAWLESAPSEPHYDYGHHDDHEALSPPGSAPALGDTAELEREQASPAEALDTPRVAATPDRAAPDTDTDSAPLPGDEQALSENETENDTVIGDEAYAPRNTAERVRLEGWPERSDKALPGWNSAATELAEDELRAALEQTPESPLRLFAWGLGSLLLLAAMAAQGLWLYRDRLAQNPQWRPTLVQFCGVIERMAACELAPLRAVSQIALQSRALQPNPAMPGAFDVHLILANNARFAQPYPVIELAFTDLDGKRLAARRFKPEEYLAPEQKDQAMPVGVPVHVRFAIVTPNPTATGFEFRFY